MSDQARFHHIRLVLAREPGHPDGDIEQGYDLVLPLKPDRRLDAAACRKQADRCRVRRFRDGATDAVGRLAEPKRGQWVLDFEPGEDDDEPVFRLTEEAFVTGEYVSITDADGETHVYQVIKVEPLRA